MKNSKFLLPLSILSIFLLVGCNNNSSSISDSSENNSSEITSSEESSSEESSSEESSSEESSSEEILDIKNYIETDDKHVYTETIYTLNSLNVTASRSENYHFVVKVSGDIETTYKYNFVFDLSSLTTSKYGIQTYGVSVDLINHTYDCYYLDGSEDSFDKSLVDVRTNQNNLYLNIALNEIDDDFDTSDVRFVTFLETDNNDYVTPSCTYNDIDITNPSTFVYVTTSNGVVSSSFNIYDIDNDTTEYINLGVFKQNMYHRDITIDIYRNNNEALLIKFTHNFSSWNKSTNIKIYLDGDDYFTTYYQETTYFFEINPATLTINYFKNILSNVPVDNGYTLSAKDNVILMNIDLTKLPEIKDGDIGVGGYSANNSYYSAITYYNGNDFIIGNVSSLARITPLNEYKYLDPKIYDSNYDTNQYIDLDINIAGSTNSGVTLGKTNVKLARKGKYLLVLFTTSDAVWNTNAACWLYIDGGSADKTVRDDDSFSIRLVANPASVKNYFKIAGNVALNNSKINLRSNDTQLYACIDMSEMNATYDTKDIGVATCLANNSNSVVMSVNSYTNSSVVLTNPSTFLRISKDNVLLTDVTKTEFGSYVLEKDNTAYISGVKEEIPSTANTQAFSVEFSRSGNIVTVRCMNNNSLWNAKQRIWLYIECFNPYSTSRTDGHTSSMRVNPSTETALQYFIIRPNTALNLKTVTVKSSETYCYISFDITAINSSYTDGDVAIIVGSSYATNDNAASGGTWATSGNYNNLTNISTARPSDWVHLTHDNKIGTGN